MPLVSFVGLSFIVIWAVFDQFYCIHSFLNTTTSCCSSRDTALADGCRNRPACSQTGQCIFMDSSSVMWLQHVCKPSTDIDDSVNKCRILLRSDNWLSIVEECFEFPWSCFAWLKVMERGS